MAGPIDELLVDMRAGVTTLRTDLSAGLTMFKSTTSKMEGAIASVRSAFGTLAAVAGIGSLTVLAKSTVDAHDNLSKMAAMTGVSVEKLTSLQYAADLSGVELGELRMGLQKLSISMNNAVQGNKKAVDLWDRLGVPLRTATGGLREADEVLNDVADRLAAMPNGAEKSALAFQVFGKAGSKMIPLLNGGAAGLRDMADEAKKFGLVVSTEAAAQAEAFNDNLSRLTASGKGLVNAVLAGALPAMEGLTTRLVDAISTGDIFAKVTDGVAEAIRWAGEYSRVWMYALKLVTGWMTKTDDAGNSIVGTLKALVGRLKSSHLAAGALAIGFKVLTQFGIMAEGVIKLVIKRVESLLRAADKVASADWLDKPAAIADAFTDTMADGVVDSFETIVDVAKKSFDNVTTSLDDTLQAAAVGSGEFENMLAPLLTDGPKAAAAARDLGDEIEEAGKKAKASKDAGGKADLSALEFLARMSDELEEVNKTEAQRRAIQFDRLIYSEEEAAMFNELQTQLILAEASEKARLASIEARAKLEEAELERMNGAMKELAGGMIGTFEQFFLDPFGDGLSNALAEFANWTKQIIAKTLATVAVLTLLNAVMPGAGVVVGSGGGLAGAILGFAEGGLVNGQGTGTSDSNLAWLSDGEFVMNADSVDRWGAGLLAAMNGKHAPGYASGGLVGGGAGGYALKGGAAPVFNMKIDARNMSVGELERMLPNAARNMVLAADGAVAKDLGKISRGHTRRR